MRCLCPEWASSDRHFGYSPTNAYAPSGHPLSKTFRYSVHRETVAKANRLTMEYRLKNTSASGLRTLRLLADKCLCPEWASSDRHFTYSVTNAYGARPSSRPNPLHVDKSEKICIFVPVAYWPFATVCSEEYCPCLCSKWHSTQRSKCQVTHSFVQGTVGCYLLRMDNTLLPQPSANCLSTPLEQIKVATPPRHLPFLAFGSMFSASRLCLCQRHLSRKRLHHIRLFL